MLTVSFRWLYGKHYNINSSHIALLIDQLATGYHPTLIDLKFGISDATRHYYSSYILIDARKLLIKCCWNRISLQMSYKQIPFPSFRPFLSVIWLPLIFYQLQLKTKVQTIKLERYRFVYLSARKFLIILKFDCCHLYF